MVEGSRDLPLIKRSVVRVVVLDASERVLLLHTRDLSNPVFEILWELPGGGMEPGETYVDAIVRELREETGIRIDPDRVGRPSWRRDVSYVYRGARRLQQEIVVRVHLQQTVPAIEASRQVDFEAEDIFGFRWWPIDEVVSSSERFYPRNLSTLLPRFLAGEEIEEPFEFWP
jgi:8-oxo-dGTP pyrophosphatase MutT (NUDIX family)